MAAVIGLAFLSRSMNDKVEKAFAKACEVGGIDKNTILASSARRVADGTIWLVYMNEDDARELHSEIWGASSVVFEEFVSVMSNCRVDPTLPRGKMSVDFNPMNS